MSVGERSGTRLGLVGCGRWGSFILRDLLLLGCDVTVVASSDDSRSRATAGGATRIVGGVAEMGTVDGVVIATPTSTHVDVLDTVLPLDVPVFVEKPLSNEATGPRRLAATVADRVFVMHKWRYHPGVVGLAGLARSGSLGTIEGLRLIRTEWVNPHTDVDSIWILAPHDLSIALTVLGAVPRPRSVVGRQAGGRHTALFAILGDDPWVHLEVGSGFGRRERRAELFGTEGTAVLSSVYEEEIVIYRGDDRSAPVEERIAVSGEWPLLAELRAFVHHVQGGPPPMSSLHDEVAIIDAIIELRRLAGLS